MVVIWCSKLLESYLQLLFTLINKIPDYEGCIFSICSNIIIPTSECLPSMFPDMKKATSIFIQNKNLFYTACYIHFSISSGGVFVPGFSIICRNFVPSLHWLNDSKSKVKNVQVTTENNITVMQGCPCRSIVSLSQRDRHMSPIRQRDASDPKRHFVLNRHWCDWWWILWWTVTFSHFPFYIPFLGRHRS